MTTDALAAHHLDRWRTRLPRAVLSLGGPLLVGAGTVASIVVSETGGPELYSVAEVTSPTWALTSLAVGAALGLAVLLALRPHLAAPWAALAATAIAVVDPTVRMIWLAVAALLAVAAVLDRGDAARQRALAPPTRHGSDGSAGTATPRPLEPQQDVAADLRAHRFGRWTMAGAAAVLLGLGCVGWFVRDARLADDFRADARPAAGVVTGVSDDGMTALVRTSDGRDLRVPLPTLWLDEGDRVQVLVGADGRRAELVGDPFDATGVLLPAGGLLATGGLLLVEGARRRRRLRDLLDRGARATEVILVPARDAWLEARDRESGRLVAALAVEGGWWPHEDDDRPDDGDHEAGAHDPWEDGDAQDVETLSDAELLDLARAAGADIEAVPEGASDDEEPMPATLIGLGAFGDAPVLASTADGGWLVVSDVRARVPRRRRSASRGPLTDSGPERLARSTGAWLPWLMLPVLAGLGWFVADGDLWQGAFLLPAALGGYGWAASATPRVTVSRHGLRIALMVVDLPVPWARVERVVHDEHAVVIRVVDPSDAHLLPEVQGLGPLVTGTVGAEQAAAVLEEAHRSAARRADPVPAHWSWRRPTAPALIAVAWATALAGGALLSV